MDLEAARGLPFKSWTMVSLNTHVDGFASTKLDYTEAGEPVVYLILLHDIDLALPWRPNYGTWMSLNFASVPDPIRIRSLASRSSFHFLSV